MAAKIDEGKEDAVVMVRLPHPAGGS